MNNVINMSGYFYVIYKWRLAQNVYSGAPIYAIN